MEPKIAFRLIFAGPVRVGTGRADKGLDEIVDSDNPLSATSLKGVLRDSARLLVRSLDSSGQPEDGQKREEHPFVTEVFGGGHGQVSPWNFSVDIPQASQQTAARAGIKIDDSLGIVEPGALIMKEEVWFDSSLEKAPTLQIWQRGIIDSEEKVNAHLALIHLAARLTQKVGQRKARGMGWVSFELVSPDGKTNGENATKPRTIEGDVAAVTEALKKYKSKAGQENMQEANHGSNA